MKIALDISPLSNNNLLLHRVRGVGFYINNLISSLKKYASENEYLLVQNSDESFEAQVIHVPYFEPFFLSLPRVKGKKLVVTVHDLTPLVFPEDFPSGIKGKIKWQIQKKRLREASAIITDSERSKKDVEKFVGIKSDKIHVVYLAAGDEFGVRKSGQWEHVSKKYNLPKEYFLYVGDATWNKNLPRLVEACKRAGVNLVMVGKTLKDSHIDNNPWNKDLKIIKEMLDNCSNITTLGFVDTEELVALYNNALALLMPSLYEGFGLPIVEAMKCSCPVITSREGSIPEIADDAVLYVDPYDLKSIIEGIEKVRLDKKIRKDLSSKGLLQAKKFSWKKTALETAKVYNEVLNEKNN